MRFKESVLQEVFIKNDDKKNKKHNKNTTKERKEHFRSSLEKRAISCSYNKYYIRHKAHLIKHF